MSSITTRLGPLPNVRVTSLIAMLPAPQFAHRSDHVDGDEDESASDAALGNRFCAATIARAPTDDVLDFLRFPVARPPDDRAREDDVFEVDEREAVIRSAPSAHAPGR
jgi:hypothetical protein